MQLIGLGTGTAQSTGHTSKCNGDGQCTVCNTNAFVGYAVDVDYRAETRGTCLLHLLLTWAVLAHSTGPTTPSTAAFKIAGSGREHQQQQPTWQVPGGGRCTAWHGTAQPPACMHGYIDTCTPRL